MLVIMTIDHTSLFIRSFTFSPVGFFAAAMGFIYLSSFVYGLVYSRYIESPSFLIRKTYKRIFLIYKYHVVSFLLMLLIGWMSIFFFNIDSAFYTANIQPTSIAKFFLLISQPGYLNILPLYIFFLLFSPFILLGLKKGYAKQILFSSFLIWLIFQFKITQDFLVTSDKEWKDLKHFVGRRLRNTTLLSENVGAPHPS